MFGWFGVGGFSPYLLASGADADCLSVWVFCWWVLLVMMFG